MIKRKNDFFWSYCKPVFVVVFTILFCSSSGPVCAEEDGGVDLNKIVVSSTEAAEWIVSSNTQSIDKKDIEKSAALNVEDFFEKTPFIDVQRRSFGGAQSDVALRGGSFEQTLLMIDGVPVNDTQTGHYTADIPLGLTDIKRINITNSASSHFYGAGAFSGAVNIIPDWSSDEDDSLSYSFGGHQLKQAALSAGLVDTESFGLKAALEHQSSSGWSQDTDFDINSMSLVMDSPRVKGLAAVKKKHYGVATKYSNFFPHQEDNVQSEFFYLKGLLMQDETKLNTRVYFRHHTSEYLLDRNNPDFFKNNTADYSAGQILTFERELEAVVLRVGGDIAKDWIESTNLGDHQRDHGALFAGVKAELLSGVVTELSGRCDYYQRFGYQSAAGISLSFDELPLESTSLVFSANRGFRVPTFTELYYNSPGNVGNEGLKPETVDEISFSCEGLYRNFDVKAGVFRRYGKDLIDWGRNDELSVWQVENVSRNVSDGAEITVSYLSGVRFSLLNIDDVSAGYRYIYSDDKGGFLYSKYVFNYLRHRGFVNMGVQLPFEFRMNLNGRYEERLNRRPVFWLDARLARNIELKRVKTEVFVSVSNILDDSYDDSDGVPAPGRWVSTGVKFEF